MIFNKDKYFSCYSPNLKDYLVNNGFEIKHQFVNIHNNKTCWIFDKNDNISIYLIQWTKNRNNIKIE